MDVIYIDPPYNTGNKDFKYNDRFVDREDSYRHSKWLSFMHKRLTLARTLLKPEGVIFISIDDNEQAQLKLLCDRVFGEANSIGPIIQDKQNSKNDTINVQKNHEYVIIYRNSILKENDKVIPSLVNSDSKPKAVYEQNNLYYFLNDPITTRGEGGTLNARPNLGHTIYYNPESKDIKAVCDYDTELAKTSNELNELYTNNEELINQGYTPIRPPKVRSKLGCWTWSLDKINAEKINLTITGKRGSYAVRKRTFLPKESITVVGNKKLYVSENNQNSRSILSFSTNDGTEELSEILGLSGKFNNPKNRMMLGYFIQLIPNTDALVLDFFAGSGTTLHAVMALNAEDGGNRQCILVTNNENNIAEEVCYERNRRVIEGYTNNKGVAVPGLTANHLHYYQTAYVGRERTLANKRALMLMATELIQIKEGCFASLNKEWQEEEGEGKPIRLFTNDNTDRYVVVIYDEDAIDTAVALIQNLPATVARVNVYVFAPGFYPYTDDFADVADRIELTALPEAIYQAYGRLLPPAGIPADVMEDAETTSAVPENPTLLFSRP